MTALPSLQTHTDTHELRSNIVFLEGHFIFTDAWPANLTLEGESPKVKIVEDDLADVVYITCIHSTEIGYLDFSSLISHIWELQPVM